MQILGKLLHIFCWHQQKINLFYFFFMKLLINYVGVIVPSFKLFDLVEIALWLFIENTSKSKRIPGLQTVWSSKLTYLRKFRIGNITFLKCQMYIYSFILVRTCPFANFVCWKVKITTFKTLRKLPSLPIKVRLRQEHCIHRWTVSRYCKKKNTHTPEVCLSSTRNIKVK